MKKTVTIEIDDREVRTALGALQARMGNLRPALDEVGEVLLDRIMTRFARSQAPDGTPWAANSPTTLDRATEDDHGNGRTLLVIDEANKLGWRVLETIRYLADECRFAVLLIGTELYTRKFTDARTRPLLEQLGGRIGAKRAACLPPAKPSPPTTPAASRSPTATIGKTPSPCATPASPAT